LLALFIPVDIIVSMQEKYHLTFKDGRSTITVDSILVQMMAFKLGYSPGDEAHAAVRLWIQENLVRTYDMRKNESNKSQWVRRKLVEEISDKKLRKMWQNWYLED
jgi:hypothetical protein